MVIKADSDARNELVIRVMDAAKGTKPPDHYIDVDKKDGEFYSSEVLIPRSKVQSTTALSVWSLM